MPRPALPNTTTRRGFALELLGLAALCVAAWPLTVRAQAGLGTWGMAAYLAALAGVLIWLSMVVFGRRLADAGYPRIYAAAPFAFALLAFEAGGIAVFLIKFAFAGMAIWLLALPSRRPEGGAG